MICPNCGVPDHVISKQVMRIWCEKCGCGKDEVDQLRSQLDESRKMHTDVIKDNERLSALVLKLKPQLVDLEAENLELACAIVRNRELMRQLYSANDWALSQALEQSHEKQKSWADLSRASREISELRSQLPGLEAENASLVRRNIKLSAQALKDGN
jgi:hypothetical protein